MAILRNVAGGEIQEYTEMFCFGTGVMVVADD